MRTNVVIDDDIIRKAIRLSRLKTKREVIDRALREFVETCARKDLRELRGQIAFADDYDYKTHRDGGIG